MFKKIVDYFKAPVDIPVTMNYEEVAKAYKKGRIDIFSSCFIGYTVFHLTRKNIATALPALEQDLGYSNLQLGLLGSALYFAYMFGKFINGVVADKADARKFFKKMYCLPPTVPGRIRRLSPIPPAPQILPSAPRRQSSRHRYLPWQEAPQRFLHSWNRRTARA